MTFITANDFNAQLGAGIAAIGTSLTVVTGQGARAPVVAAPDRLACVIFEQGVGYEYVDITAHTAASDTFTISRHVDDYQSVTGTGLAFTTAAKIYAVVSKRMLENAEPIWVPNQAALPAKKAGGIQLISRNLGGRSLPEWVSPTGVDFFFQSALWESNVVLWKPGSATVPNYMGDVPTLTGTVTRPAPAAGSFGAEMARQAIASAATLNTAVGLLGIAAPFARIVAAGHGGFFIFGRIRLEAVTAASLRFFMGVSSIAALPLVDPSTSAVSMAGFGYDAADTTLQMIVKDGTTARKVSVTGSVDTTGGTYDCFMFVEPGDGTAAGKVYWAVYNTDSGVLLASDLTGSVTNAPLANTMMRPIFSVGTSAAAAQTVSFAGFYVISDY